LSRRADGSITDLCTREAIRYTGMSAHQIADLASPERFRGDTASDDRLNKENCA
jgi:hypothetical protein